MIRGNACPIPGLLPIFTALFTVLLLGADPTASRFNTTEPTVPPEDFRFLYFTIEEGLSQNSVHCIFQDSKGFMWFGTDDGLNRYDGYGFTVYRSKPSDPTTLSHISVTSIIEMPTAAGKREFWVGTRQGLNRFDPDTLHFTRFQHRPGDPSGLSDSRILCLYGDSRGQVWAGTEGGLNRFVPRDQSFEKYNIRNANPAGQGKAGNQVFCLLEDRSGTLWSGMERGLYRLAPGSRGLEQVDLRIPGPVARNLREPGVTAVPSLYEDSRGAIWFGTIGAGLGRLSPATGEVRWFSSRLRGEQEFRLKYIGKIQEDSYGRLWIASKVDGVLLFDIAAERYIHKIGSGKPPHSLSYHVILNLYADRGGGIWIATYGGGVNLWHPSLVKFMTYQKQHPSPKSPGVRSVRAIYEDSGGTLWLGGYIGLDKLDRRTGQITYFYPDKLPYGSIRCIRPDPVQGERVLWMGTEAAPVDLFSFDKNTGTIIKTFRFKEIFGFDCPALTALLPDASGQIWAGTPRGLIKIDPAGGDHRLYLSPHGIKARSPAAAPESAAGSSGYNHVTALFRDTRGVLWIGSYYGGIHRFDPISKAIAHFKHEPGAPPSLLLNVVNVIEEDRRNNLWIGTSGAGLIKYITRSGRFEQYTTKDGLPNNVIYGILKGRAGNLWLSTNRGLCRFDPHARTCRNFDADDGLQSNEFNSGAYYKSKKGELFFGGIDGINAFYPGQIRENRYTPPIVFTGFLLFNQPVLPGRGGKKHPALSRNITDTTSIKLSYEDYVFSFNFTALNYVFPEKNRYAYKMEGFEDNWNYVGNRHFVTYTSLPHGSYTFRVKGCNNDGYWNEAGASMSITITPPFWKTWWFQGAAILLIALLILFLHRLRTRHFKKVNLQLQEGNENLNRQITERIRAEQELQNYKRQLEVLVEKRTSALKSSNLKLEEANKELESFSYSVSHDLRAPLRAIEGFAQIFLEDHAARLDNEGKRLLNIIRGNTDRMGQLIDDLLAFSRMSRREMAFAVIDMQELVNDVIEELKHQQTAHTVRFQVHPLPPAYGDRSMLRQVLVNLLSNAVKFSRNREPALVEVGAQEPETQEDRNRPVYYIKDNGVGFDMDYAHKLFGVFQRLHGTEEFEGTGVGLALVHRILTRHGGSIRAESELDKGTVFYFTLPVEVV